MQHRSSYRIGVLMLIVLVLSGCVAQSGGDLSEPTHVAAPIVTDTVQPTQPSTGQPLETTSEPITTPQIGVGGTACLPPGEGQNYYMNETTGVCFLYSASYTLTEQADELAVWVSGPPVDPNAMESSTVSFGVNVIAVPGAAANVTAADFAHEVLARYPGEPIAQEEATIAGQPAVVLNGMPGMGVYRLAYLVVNNTLYELSMSPDPSAATVLQADAQTAWDLLVSSLVFLPPTASGDYVSPEEVCPAESAGYVRYGDRYSGYCLLYPSTFSVDTEFPGSLVGGPDIGAYPEYPGASRVRLAMGGPYPIENETLSQLVDRYLVNSVEGQYTREDMTIGGFPGIVIKDMSPPVPEWTAYLDVNGQLYTLLVSPTDFSVIPEAQQPVEEIWNSVTQTIQFFTPWR